jgi:hypothetical protein
MDCEILHATRVDQFIEDGTGIDMLLNPQFARAFSLQFS